jgi:hypothetical protein
MISVNKSNKFENFILLAIFVSSVALTLENPLNDPKGSTVFLLRVSDLCTTTLFLIEAVVKIVAGGFLLNGPESYLRNAANVLDFFIIVPAIISYLPFMSDFKIIKIIRMIRLLRPLRFINKNENLRISIQALFISLPAIGSLFIIVVLVMLIFAIIAVNLFKGKSFYCDIKTLNPQDTE